jgi:hypothetical protein
VGGNGVRVHNTPVAMDRVPVITKVSRRVMLTALLVKSDVQPWTHRCVMDRRELDARLGKMCA